MRIGERTRAIVKELARERGIGMQEVVDDAVELYRRQLILDAGNAAYAALREDPEAWQDYQSEIKAWDATLADGLEA